MAHPFRLTTTEDGTALPHGLAQIMRPELGSLAKEIVQEIRHSIPEYSRPLEGPYGQAIIAGVQQAITLFVNQVADPSAPSGSRDEICRQLGRNEVLEGRSLDTLQAAYRIGARVSWQRIMRVGRHYELSSTVMSRLAEAVFEYMDELAGLSFEGYVQAKARTTGAVDQWSRRLLNLLLQQPPAPAEAIAELAQTVGWTPPERVALVAVQATDDAPPRGGTTAGSAALRALLPGTLAELEGSGPHLLLPDRLPAEHQAELAQLLPGRLIAIGPMMPIAEAATSLRWARQALALAEAGTITGGPVIRCEEHLATLWLCLDSALVREIYQRRFAVLGTLTEKQRLRLAETLMAWLSTRGSAPEIAGHLDVHPQTVRYRMRQLERAFGDALTDPDARFEMELVLRAEQLLRRAGDG